MMPRPSKERTKSQSMAAVAAHGEDRLWSGRGHCSLWKRSENVSDNGKGIPEGQNGNVKKVSSGQPGASKG